MTTPREGDTARLIEFLHDRDAPCPLCGYNLRNLSTDVCPECRHELRLTVGVHHVRFGWFLALLAPFLFSGILAVLMLILTLVIQLGGGNEPPPGIVLINCLAFGGGAVALVLIVRRHWFIRLRPQVQRRLALGAWALHAITFAGFLLLVLLT